ncbi:MAG: class I SAM-dependent methyltransferase [Desulfobacterales bacterium]
MGYVFDFQDAVAFEGWMRKPENDAVFRAEMRLLCHLLRPRAGETILDIGCGTGMCLEAFVAMGLRATGIEPSEPMLEFARRRVGRRAELHRGVAEELPFEDNAFHHACLFTTLEFVDDPRRALAEACRVAKDRVFIGVLNRYAIKGLERRIRGLFAPSIYNHARFFSLWQVKTMLRELVGPVPITWRSVCQLPIPAGRFAPRFENPLLARCPFGAFVGVVAVLMPRVRTRPLALRCPQGAQTPGAVPG